jgi:hypothetical protein
VLVVEAGGTPAPTVRRAKDALTRSRVPLLGVVLNKFDSRFATAGYDVELGYGPAPHDVVPAPRAVPAPDPAPPSVDPGPAVAPPPLGARLAGDGGRGPWSRKR